MLVLNIYIYIYIIKPASNQTFSPSNKILRELSRANQHPVPVLVYYNRTLDDIGEKLTNNIKYTAL